MVLKHLCKELKFLLFQKIYHFGRESFCCDFFLPTFFPSHYPPHLHSIWWFLGFLLGYYFDNPANNINFLFSEVDKKKKKAFSSKIIKVSTSWKFHCSSRIVMAMAVWNNRERGRRELSSCLEDYEELTAVENETDWAFPFCSTGTSHAVWRMWFRLHTRSLLTNQVI